MACHLTDDSFKYLPTEDEEDDEEEEHLPNSSIRWWHLDGRTSPGQALLHPWTVIITWPVPLPLLYSLEQLHPTPENAPTPHYEVMDLSNIFDFPDMMTTTRDENIPGLGDVSGLWIWTEVWIHFDTPQTLYTWNRINTFMNTETCMIMDTHKI